MKKILFISAGPYYWGSSRMRCYWPAEVLGADVLEYDRVKNVRWEVESSRWDVFIFQKYGQADLQEYLLEAGKQVYWDVCDPMWWFSPVESRSISEHLTGVVASSEALALDYQAWDKETPVAYIPDRLKLAHFPNQRIHGPYEPVRFIWYGIAANRVALAAAWANLARLRANGRQVQLTIFDDRPDLQLGFGDEVPTYHVRWNLEDENEILSSHDIALLPPYPGPWGEVKSNNKTLTAWACGLPVTTGMDYAEMERLYWDYLYRQADAIDGYQTVVEYGQVEKSAADWSKLIEHV